MLEKHYIKFLEDILYSAKFMHQNIKHLETVKSDLEKGISTNVSSIPISLIKVSKTFNVSDLFLDNLIKKEDAITEISIKIYTEKKLLKAINDTLDNLDPTTREIIRLRYFKEYIWSEISDKLYLDKKTIRNKKNIALKNLATTLWGTDIFVSKVGDLYV